LLSKQIDSIFSILKENNLTTFNFENFTKTNIWNWHSSKNIIKADAFFYKRFLMNKMEFSGYEENYQDIYYLGITQIGMIKYLIIGQWIHNDDESNMYLIDFDKYGVINKVFSIAGLYKGPDDYYNFYSHLKNNILVRITIKRSTLPKNQQMVIKDSIIEYFNAIDLKRLKYDSIRKN